MLRALALTFLLLVPAHAQDATPDKLPDLRATALEAINADRMARDLDRLERGETLDTIAERHAADMLARGYFAHEGQDGGTVRDRFLAAGGSDGLIVGENIAKCTGCPPPDAARVRELQRGWMNSPGHRRNILTRGFERFGFGIAHRDGRQYAVQTFAGAGADEGDTLSMDAVLPTLIELVNERRARPLEAASDLTETLRAQAGMGAMPDLGSLLSGTRFGRASLLSASCGGCGPAVTRADLEGFVERWAANRPALTGDFTHAAAAAYADGAGRNRAFLLLVSER